MFGLRRKDRGSELTSKSTKDDLVKDLQDLLKESRDQDNEVNENTALEKLVMYIVDRDHRILEHGRKIGVHQVLPMFKDSVWEADLGQSPQANTTPPSPPPEYLPPSEHGVAVGRGKK